MTQQKWLQLGPGIRFPLTLITQTIALLAVKRAGKSNAAAVMAEEMYRAGLPWVAIDPKGDWWGLRADGTKPGLPIPVFGGLHGDMGLTPDSGALMAELIVELNLTCVLEVSQFSKGQLARFLVDFGDRLFRLHQKDPQPRMLFLEECDEYCPQKVMRDMARCVGMISKMVKQGGAFGLGIAIISQRAAVVNKDILTQVDGAMIALRTTSPQDRKAIRDWMDTHAVVTEVVDSLPSLADGEAWISSPHWLPQHGGEALQRARFRQRETFDSGATPLLGQQRKAATIADVDLGALEARMAAVTEQAAQNDPAALRRKIAALERLLKAAESSAPADAALIAENAALKEHADRLGEALAVQVTAVQGQLRAERAAAEQAAAHVRDALAILTADRDEQFTLEPAPPRGTGWMSAKGEITPIKITPPPTRPAPTLEVTRDAPTPVASNGTGSLPKAQRAILTVLAQFPERTKNQLGMLSGYSPKSSSFGNALGALRSAEMINRGHPIQITDAGREALGDDWVPLPTGTALRDHWMRQLGKAERTILTALLGAWPNSMNRDELAEASNYSAASSSFGNALGKLRTLELVNRGADIRADETFAQEVTRG